jgi:hypothetical protein
MSRISRDLTIGLSWAVTWVLAGLLPARLIAGNLNPEHIGGPLYAGFACGVLFVELAGSASGRRRLNELSSYRAAFHGAVGGLFVGVLPFVIGDNGRYQSGWSLLIVAAAATLAGIVARRWLGEGSVLPALTLVAVITGILAGALPWFLTTEDRLARLLPLGLMIGMAAVSALSGVASRFVVRWMKQQMSQAASAGH